MNIEIAIITVCFIVFFLAIPTVIVLVEVGELPLTKAIALYGVSVLIVIAVDDLVSLATS
mgnify:CR=1 FL=1